MNLIARPILSTLTLGVAALFGAGTALAAPTLPGWSKGPTEDGQTIYSRLNGDVIVLSEMDGIGFSLEETFELSKKALEVYFDCASMTSMPTRRNSGGQLEAENRDGTVRCYAVMDELPGGAARLVVAQSGGFNDRETGARRTAQRLLSNLTDGTSLALPVPGATSTTASPRSSQSTTPARRATTGGGEAAAKAVLDSVPKSRRPIAVTLSGSGSYVGWPPSYVYRVSTILIFENGYATRCADWDPTTFEPTPQSLGRADPKCGVTPWRKRGGNYELKADDGSWEAFDGTDTLVRFTPGQRIDVAFGNVSAIGYSGSGMVSVGKISGDTVNMTRAGEIALGDWSTTVISGSNVGGGGSRESGPVIGRYYLDGNMIAIAEPDGSVRVGFIAGVSENGRLAHIYLNGTHYWDRND